MSTMQKKVQYEKEVDSPAQTSEFAQSNSQHENCESDWNGSALPHLSIL